MRAWITGLVTALAVSVTVSQACAQADATWIQDVAKAEADFAAETKAKGFHRGFIAWSTPDALGFFPQAGNFHQRLTEQLAADPTLAEKPTPLRWWPYHIGISDAGDIAYDLGPWEIEGTDKAGWFFTIWQKQADGSWKWTLDGGAGKDKKTLLPRDNRLLSSFMGADDPDAAAGLLEDDALNSAYATRSAADVLAGRDTAIASTDTAPYINDPFAAAPSEAVWAAVVADRPGVGQTWTRDGYGASKAGDFVYTWGRASGPDGTYLGHYVRVWQKMPAGVAGWKLSVDLFQT